ncbi:phosphopantetheine-binding protein [Martelella alba]|uniref:Carrier domain-containing protein n=1 Tax=Martelella alba TaxID=2590451 RepID=A0ABY2SE40_9HYPH|nr:phosphopantetheine-binding protein [Martelella alba]TKI01774.1 hypothetical protein FCN80_26145 [Martelella alba]
MQKTAMDDISVSGRLRALLAYKLGWRQEEVHESLHLINELYVDSLDLVEIDIGILETFDVQLSKNDFQAAETVGDLRFIIERRLWENNPTSPEARQ